MPEDLAQLVRGLSPGALDIFKRQIQALPEAEKQRAFSRLSGIAELSDIIGRPTPMREIETPSRPQPIAQPPTTDIPLWQRALQTVGTPFQWISQNITEPFGAYAASPFTPAVAGTEGMGFFERERAEYKGWEGEPKFRIPGTEWDVGVKGVLETLPWLMLPSAGTVAGRLGAIAAGGGALGRGAALAGKMVAPIAMVESLPGKAIGKAAKKIKGVPDKVTPAPEVIPVTPEITKIRTKLARIDLPNVKVSGSYAAGTATSASDIDLLVGIPDNQWSGITLRKYPKVIQELYNTLPEDKMSIHLYKLSKPNKLWHFQRPRVEEGKHLSGVFVPVDYSEDMVNGLWSKAINTQAISKAEAGIPPAKPPLPPTAVGGISPEPPVPPVGAKIVPELFPEGLAPERAAAVGWITGLAKASKPLTKKTLELRKREHAFRSAEYERLLQEKIAQGTPIKQAEAEATQQALSGVYPEAPLTPAFLEQLKDQGKYETTLLRMLADATFQYGFERKNAFKAFWDLLQEGHLQLNQIQTLERVFGSELAKVLLEKHRTLGQKIWFNAVDAINIPRGLLSMADISGFGRQGWILTTTRPGKAVEAFVPMLQSMLSEKNAAFMDNVFLNRKHMDKVLKLRPDFFTKWAGEATDIVAREEGFASRWLNKMPIVGQIYKGSTRAYTTVLNDLRSANVSAAISGWEKKGLKYLTPKEAEKLYANNAKAIFDAGFYTDLDIDLTARAVSWASGRGSLPPELARHAGIANAVFFAPKLIASRIEFPLAVLPFVTPSRLARQEAMRELLSFLGVGGGILSMAVLSGQADVELDMRSPDFGKLKVEDTRLDIWTGYSQYIRFIAQMATAQGKTESGRITAKDRSNLIKRFVQSKLSPAAGFINDWIAGETYLGEDMPPKSAKSILGQLYQRTMPLAIQDLVDGYLEDSWSGGIVSSAGFFGVGVVTYTDEVKRARDKAAKQQYGLSWDEVGRQYGRATQLKLEQTAPAIKSAVEEHEDRFAGGTPTTMDTFRSLGKTAEETYRKDIDNAVREFRATGDGVRFREKVDDASRARRKVYATREKMPEFQDIVSYYQQPLAPEATSKLNPGDILHREYNQQMFGLDMYDEFGNYLFDEAEKREQAFLTRYGQQALDYIEDYRGARWVDKPAELRMLEEARDLLRPYWQITNQVWSMYPPELKVLSDQIILLERTDPAMAKQMVKRYPSILRARELIAQYRKQMREYNPMIQQAHRLFYG